MRTRTALLALLAAAAAITLAAAPAEAADGKAVFLAEKCNLCHAVSSAGIEATTKSEAMKGPDLSTTGPHDAAALAKYLKQEEAVDGKKHKKGFKGTDEDLQALIAWLNEQAAAE